MRLERIHCRNCGGLLCRAFLEGGSILEAKCDRCHALNTITARPVDRMAPDGLGGYAIIGSEPNKQPPTVSA